MKTVALFVAIILLLTLQLFSPESGQTAISESALRATINTLSSYGSRATGSKGYKASETFIEQRLQALGLETETQLYELPVRRFLGASIQFAGKKYPLSPFIYNSVTPEATDSLTDAPLYYVGHGELSQLDGIAVKGAVILLDFDSGRNWQTLASLGAKAVIFIGSNTSNGRIFFTEKNELTPIQFPCFWITRSRAIDLFGSLTVKKTPLIAKVTIRSRCVWENSLAKNIYALIKGTDPQLKDELLIVESFFDNEEFVFNNSPGADAASSIATFLEVAKSLTAQPLKRSVLLLVTSGQAQTLAGMREVIWSLNARSKDLRNSKRRLKKILAKAKNNIALLSALHFPLPEDKKRDQLIGKAISHSLGFTIDQISRRLIRLRLGDKTTATKLLIKKTAKQRYLYRKLTWAESFHNLPAKETALFKQLIPRAIERNELVSSDTNRRLQALISSSALRSTVWDFDVAAIVSLHLSSHGDGVGAFNRGWLYNLKQTINRTSSYSLIAKTLENSAGKPIGRARYQDTLRPSHLRTWDSWFFDKPILGGEVSAMAGYIGLSLVTTGDGRALWGTPTDTVEKIDWTYLHDQAHLVEKLILGLTKAKSLHTGSFPRDGFVTVTARANLLLQGELFASHPARKTTILAYQGLNKYYAMVNETGYFTIKGLADKKNVLDKLIIEGYRFDEKSGKVIWAIDKKTTGKRNYRLKLLRKSMKTNLVLFNCRETTLFDLLEPRSLTYMTKLHLYDGRRDAPPEHYWYSRIDTRASIIASIYTEPGTLLKLTLSDTVLTNKIVLTNASKERPMGAGYLTDDYPTLPNTIYHAAKDEWALLGPRIHNLESHGIYDEKINTLKTQGIAALEKSTRALDSLNYSVSRRTAAEALALAARVYAQVEKTQKDVLFGVLFYIALFVPFAFVMERFLFNFATIYKRIIGFSAILLLLIVIIYNVHPAFDLAYSPTIVILAFFIIGLSFMVTLIIFFRFEDEMILLQRRATHRKIEDISRWKAFVAAFFLGVSNLRRRRIRTILTCTTLIILTFTIMSFTTIKSSHKQVRLPFGSTAPYKGLLLKKMNWQSMPPQAAGILTGSMKSINTAAPRVWLEELHPTSPPVIPLRKGNTEIEIQGLVGLSPNEAAVTGLDTILTSGRWFKDDDRRAIILEEQMALRLGVSAGNNQTITLWGSPFTVIGTFKAEDYEKAVDLDGEPLTPAIFPDEAGVEISEQEQDALESGEDIRSFQSRYQHIPASQTAIIPAKTLLAAGGHLKDIAIKPADPKKIGLLAAQLSDRFSLAIFTGEDDGVWLYNISDTMNYSGVPNIIIPLLISILIVLNTMISSVYERKGEIGVYTSIGLAPSHVSFLFIAEAMALAVISVVLGYLVAQISAALFSTTSLWQGITVNYSSMAGVAAMVLVMSVVLISVLYPSRVAARIAIPDVNRTFKLPKPVDNTIQVTLPFLMKFHENESIGGFIYNYLRSHQDVSHGLFATDQVEIIFSCSTVDEIKKIVAASDNPHEFKCLHIRSNVWLAPFDFGIMQTVDIQFCPAREGEDFLEISITLKRSSGESGIWQRINTSFLHELRKQLLIWRSLDNEAHEHLKQSFQKVIAGYEPSMEDE